MQIFISTSLFYYTIKFYFFQILIQLPETYQIGNFWKFQLFTQLKVRLHDFNMIYCLLRADIVAAKNLMFNVIFYVVFFNYHFKISRGGVAANFKV